jgi:hypothetical protein
MKNYGNIIFDAILLIVCIVAINWSQGQHYDRGFKRGVELGYNAAFDTITTILNKAKDDTVTYRLRVEYTDTVQYTITS